MVQAVSNSIIESYPCRLVWIRVSQQQLIYNVHVTFFCRQVERRETHLNQPNPEGICELLYYTSFRGLVISNQHLYQPSPLTCQISQISLQLPLIKNIFIGKNDLWNFECPHNDNVLIETGVITAERCIKISMISIIVCIVNVVRCLVSCQLVNWQRQIGPKWLKWEYPHRLGDFHFLWEVAFIYYVHG